MPDLETTKQNIVDQAKRKRWNRDDENWLEAKFYSEAGELFRAIENGETENKIALEGIDVIYMLMQIFEKNCPTVNVDDAFYEKYEDNAKTKKKTYVAEEGIVRR